MFQKWNIGRSVHTLFQNWNKTSSVNPPITGTMLNLGQANVLRCGTFTTEIGLFLFLRHGIVKSMIVCVR